MFKNLGCPGCGAMDVSPDNPHVHSVPVRFEHPAYQGTVSLLDATSNASPRPSSASEVRIRPAVGSVDVDAMDVTGEYILVRDSWVKSYCKGALRWLAHSGDLRAHVTRVLARSRVLVAEVPEVPEAGVIGWISFEGGHAHYAYVLRSYRGNGVYRELLSAAGLAVPGIVVCTHYTVACEKMAKWLEYRPSLIAR